jgi:hypothetical protein
MGTNGVRIADGHDTGYCTKTYDSMYQQQGAEINPAKRQQIIYQMQQMAAGTKMYLVLDYPESIEAHSTAWTAWTDLPLVAYSSFNPWSKIPFESVHLTRRPGTTEREGKRSVPGTDSRTQPRCRARPPAASLASHPQKCDTSRGRPREEHAAPARRPDHQPVARGGLRSASADGAGSRLRGKWLSGL